MRSQLTRLSPRERQVLHALTMGLGYKQAAQNLEISINTLKVHVSRTLRKLEAGSMTEAAWKCQMLGAPCPSCLAVALEN